MFRGFLNSINNTKGYTESEKDWYVELQQTTMIWYELVVNDYKEFNTRKILRQQLKELKAAVKNNIEKKFIYFICSRTKVRFSSTVEPYLIDSGTKARICVEIGREKNPQELIVDSLCSVHGYPIGIKIYESGKFISFKYSSGPNATMPIHDFLLNFGIDLEIKSTVQYTGYTENPEKRPFNGEHSGLSEILHNVSNEDNDIIIFLNLFKVTTLAVNNGFHFVVANSMIDEIDATKEGKILEKCFIFYFDSPNQYKNRKIEKKEIENNLLTISRENKIREITVDCEVDDDSEYYQFQSPSIKPKQQHLFTVKLNKQELEITEGSDLYNTHVQSIRI